MITLVLDTALHCAQAALFDGKHCLGQKMRAGDRGQAEILMPLLDEILKEAKLGWKNLSQVIVTVGPGVFTGIRTGVAVARALKLALGIPAMGVSTLQVLAAQAEGENGSRLALVDAHKGEVYAQSFSPALKALSQPMLLKADALLPFFREAGQVIAYPPTFAKTLEPQKNIQAAERLDLKAAFECAALAPLEALPLYVRAPDALPGLSAQLRRA